MPKPKEGRVLSSASKAVSAQIHSIGARLKGTYSSARRPGAVPAGAAAGAADGAFHFEKGAKRGARQGARYHEQGSAEEMVRDLPQRLALLESSQMVWAIVRFWQACGLGEGDTMSQQQYVAVMERIARALGVTANATDESAAAHALALDDWASDMRAAGQATDGSAAMPMHVFCASLFELADVWVETAEEADYVAFLSTLYYRITRLSAAGMLAVRAGLDAHEAANSDEDDDDDDDGGGGGGGDGGDGGGGASDRASADRARMAAHLRAVVSTANDLARAPRELCTLSAVQAMAAEIGADGAAGAEADGAAGASDASAAAVRNDVRQLVRCVSTDSCSSAAARAASRTLVRSVSSLLERFAADGSGGSGGSGALFTEQVVAAASMGAEALMRFLGREALEGALDLSATLSAEPRPSGHGPGAISRDLAGPADGVGRRTHTPDEIYAALTDAMAAAASTGTQLRPEEAERGRALRTRLRLRAAKQRRASVRRSGGGGSGGVASGGVAATPAGSVRAAMKSALEATASARSTRAPRPASAPRSPAATAPPAGAEPGTLGGARAPGASATAASGTPPAEKAAPRASGRWPLPEPAAQQPSPPLQHPPPSGELAQPPAPQPARSPARAHIERARAFAAGSGAEVEAEATAAQHGAVGRATADAGAWADAQPSAGAPDSVDARFAGAGGGGADRQGPCAGHAPGSASGSHAPAARGTEAGADGAGSEGDDGPSAPLADLALLSVPRLPRRSTDRRNPLMLSNIFEDSEKSVFSRAPQRTSTAVADEADAEEPPGAQHGAPAACAAEHAGAHGAAAVARSAPPERARSAPRAREGGAGAAAPPTSASAGPWVRPSSAASACGGSGRPPSSPSKCASSAGSSPQPPHASAAHGAARPEPRAASARAARHSWHPHTADDSDSEQPAADAPRPLHRQGSVGARRVSPSPMGGAGSLPALARPQSARAATPAPAPGVGGAPPPLAGGRAISVWQFGGGGGGAPAPVPGSIPAMRARHLPTRHGTTSAASAAPSVPPPPIAPPSAGFRGGSRPTSPARGAGGGGGFGGGGASSSSFSGRTAAHRYTGDGAAPGSTAGAESIGTRSRRTSEKAGDGRAERAAGRGSPEASWKAVHEQLGAELIGIFGSTSSAEPAAVGGGGASGGPPSPAKMPPPPSGGARMQALPPRRPHRSSAPGFTPLGAGAGRTRPVSAGPAARRVHAVSAAHQLQAAAGQQAMPPPLPPPAAHA